MSDKNSIFTKRSIAVAAVGRVQALVELTKDDAFLKQVFENAHESVAQSGVFPGVLAASIGSDKSIQSKAASRFARVEARLMN